MSTTVQVVFAVCIILILLIVAGVITVR